MPMAEPSKADLFIELAQPNEEGFSRWVSVSEFTGRYARLQFGNGGDWLRTGSPLHRRYRIETDKQRTPGNSIDAVRLAGHQTQELFRQNIRQDIKAHFATAKCVMLGIRGTSVNTKIEIDHKDGRKDDMRVSDPRTQRIEDFQPLCKAANDAKRQICKECRETGIRWNAKNLKGNPYPYYEGNEQFTDELRCVGCYQYDPVAYRITMVKRLIGEVTQDTLRRLYPEITDIE